MKRLIFVLLHSNGHYVLSRNFRLQRIGNIDWVLRNYDIRRVTLGVDELMILDVSREPYDRGRFYSDVERLVEACFVPTTVGGRLGSQDDIARCFAVGADKVLLNRAFYDAPRICEAVAARYGSQAVVASIDVLHDTTTVVGEGRRPFISRHQLPEQVEHVVRCGAGEILVQSVDNDGTGRGLDVSLAKAACSGTIPLILMGGVGHARHIVEGLREDIVDAVATANLLNFVGESLLEARSSVQAEGIALAKWSGDTLQRLRGSLTDPEE